MTRRPDSPDDVSFYEAFVEHAGGPEEAQRKFQEMDSYIARTTSYITLQEEAIRSSE